MKHPHLVLFFTTGISLEKWDEIGMLDREVALYRNLQCRGIRVSFVTYGGAGDLVYSKRLPGIRILPNRWGLKDKTYRRVLPILHGPFLAGASVYKTNQTAGGDVTLKAARFWRKPMVARCGYMWSEFASREHGVGSIQAHRALEKEKLVFAGATRVVVTTEAMKEDVLRRIPAAAGKTRVIPNYVDADRFQPTGEKCNEGEILFVGRLSSQKNVEALLKALRPLDVTLTIIGDGPLKAPLRKRFGTLNGRVRWLGNVPSENLPAYMNRAALFVLPSHYEGHPKSLIESMACGLAVIGADSPGIREVIRHGENGWLCGKESDDIRRAVLHLLASPEKRIALGKGARSYVKKWFSLDRIVALELSLLRDFLK